MRPRERRETGEQDLFRSRLDQFIDMKHPLATLGRAVDWGFLEERFEERLQALIQESLSVATRTKAPPSAQ